MRKIEEKVIGAFAYRRSACLSNTRSDGDHLYLHENMIARWEDGKVMFTLSGWNTPTTRSRINALARLMYKSGIYCKNFDPYREGVLLNSSQWYEL